MFDAKELSKLAASPRLRTLRLREGRHAGYGGEGGMQPMLVTHTLRLVLLTTVPLDNTMLIPVLRVLLPLLLTTHLFARRKCPARHTYFPILPSATAGDQWIQLRPCEASWFVSTLGLLGVK